MSRIARSDLIEFVREDAQQNCDNPFSSCYTDCTSQDQANCTSLLLYKLLSSMSDAEVEYHLYGEPGLGEF